MSDFRISEFRINCNKQKKWDQETEIQYFLSLSLIRFSSKSFTTPSTGLSFHRRSSTLMIILLIVPGLRLKYNDRCLTPFTLSDDLNVNVLIIEMGLAKLSQTHFYSMAGGKGVEPLFTESESVVLPLNDPPAACFHAAVYTKNKIHYQ